MHEASQFDWDFAAIAASPTYRRIEREAFGDEYPEGADPYSFTTKSELNLIADLLQVGPSMTVVDVACGQGGPGLWVARRTGSRLVGIDSSAEGVRQAVVRAAAMGLAKRSRFVVADAAATGLPDESADAAMSIDAIQLMPHKAAVVAEVRRVLRRSALFVFTTWEAMEGGPKAGRKATLASLVPLLEVSGFKVERRELRAAFPEQATALFQGWLENRIALTAELGVEVYGQLEREANRALPEIGEDERVLIIARAA
jgi:SAM-dependent methyltransferase